MSPWQQARYLWMNLVDHLAFGFQQLYPYYSLLAEVGKVPRVRYSSRVPEYWRFLEWSRVEYRHAGVLLEYLLILLEWSTEYRQNWFSRSTEKSSTPEYRQNWYSRSTKKSSSRVVLRSTGKIYIVQTINYTPHPPTNTHKKSNQAKSVKFSIDIYWKNVNFRSTTARNILLIGWLSEHSKISLAEHVNTQGGHSLE